MRLLMASTVSSHVLTVKSLLDRIISNVICRHNIRKNCRHCSKSIRQNLLFKHELVCQTNVKEQECNRFSGVQLMNDCTFHSSVSGCFRTYELNIESGKDYEDILTYSCQQAKLRILDVLQHHPIKAQLIITLNFHRYIVCNICQKPLDWSDQKNYPVRDHDHTKAKNNYRGAAHRFCNINYFERTIKVPVICHNLKGYDLHLFIINLVKSSENIQVIPETIEKFKAVMTEKFIFLNSCAFLSSSLGKLVDSLKANGGNSFPNLKATFPDNYEELTQKGIYFYDYASSYKTFSEDRIPAKEQFYNQQTQSDITDDDYEHAQKIFSKMKCKNLGEYMLLYVKTDVLLLCDVFENFRDLSLNYYGLDPCQYFSLPGLSYDAMLKMTGVKLDYITDIEMQIMIENNIRGGISTINHRLFTANNKYLSDFDPKMPSSYIMYVDANNLYGKGMSEKLPTGSFKWLSKEAVDDFNIQETDAEGETCYILDVNLEYPKAIHDLHNDYPLAVECKYIEEADLSPYNQYFLKEHNEKFKSTKKLCPDLKDKKNYVCSLKNLKFFIKQGLVLQKINRILAADQSNFLHPYIEFNSLKRRESAHKKFKSDFFKLMNNINAVYGKTIEDIRKRCKVDIVKDQKQAKKAYS